MKRAVTFGRFNFLSKGHEAFFEAILNEWDSLTVIVLDDIRSMGNCIETRKNTNFYDMCDSNWKSNMLSFSDRLEAMYVWKLNSPNSNRIEVSQFPRVEYFPDIFNNVYKAEEYDIVCSKDDSNTFDKVKVKEFESILNRKVYTVEPMFILHNQTIIQGENNIENLECFFDKYVLDYYIRKGVIGKLWQSRK